MDKIILFFSMENGINPKLLSHDAKVVDEYINDPLVHSQITARAGMMVINRGQWILGHAKNYKNKMLVMVGSGEGIVNKEAIDQFCKNAPNITYMVWPDFYHELHNEPGKNQVFDYSLNWLLMNI